MPYETLDASNCVYISISEGGKLPSTTHEAPNNPEHIILLAIFSGIVNYCECQRNLVFYTNLDIFWKF